jgi:hypothetical protein
VRDPGVGTNRYAYSANDPINKSDPNGHAVGQYISSNNWFNQQSDPNWETNTRGQIASALLRQAGAGSGRIVGSTTSGGVVHLAMGRTGQYGASAPIMSSEEAWRELGSAVDEVFRFAVVDYRKLQDPNVSWQDKALEVGIAVAGFVPIGKAAKLFRFGGEAVVAAEKGAYAAIGSTGRYGEELLYSQFGGRKQVYRNTSLGPRIVDLDSMGIAYESKVGYKSLTKDIMLQIAKDAELVGNDTYTKASWHFVPSPVTGKSGPSKPLADALRQALIETVIR